MSDTWLITITTTSPVDALLLALEFEECEIERAARPVEGAREARPHAEHACSIRTSMTIPPELRSAAAANEGWPE